MQEHYVISHPHHAVGVYIINDGVVAYHQPVELHIINSEGIAYHHAEGVHIINDEVVAYHQPVGLHIINSEGIAYHHAEGVHIISP